MLKSGKSSLSMRWCIIMQKVKQVWRQQTAVSRKCINSAQWRIVNFKQSLYWYFSTYGKLDCHMFSSQTIPEQIYCKRTDKIWWCHRRSFVIFTAHFGYSWNFHGSADLFHSSMNHALERRIPLPVWPCIFFPMMVALPKHPFFSDRRNINIVTLDTVCEGQRF